MINLTLPETESKRLEWATELLRHVSKHSTSKRWNKARYDYQKNFDRYTAQIDKDELLYFSETYGKAKPVMLASYPLLEPLMQRMIAEYTSMPMPFHVQRINKNAYSERMQFLGRLAAEKVLAPIWDAVEKQFGMKLPIDKKMDFIPEQFKLAPHKSIRDSVEVTMKYGINYLYYTYRLQDQFSACLADILINNDCIGKIDIVGNDAKITRVPIQNAIFERGEDNYIFDELHKRSPYIGTDTWMTLHDIIYKYCHRLKTEQRQKLLTDERAISDDQGLLETYNRDGYCVRAVNGGALEFRVIDIEVMAHVEKKFMAMPYQPDNDKIYNSHEIDEVWSLVRISNDTVLRPVRAYNQIPYRGNCTDLQFSYFGMLSRHSFYTKAYPIQNLYSNCMMTLDFLLSTSGGKATRYATERTPDGMEYEDVAYSAKILGLVVEQVRAGDIPGRSTAGGEVDFGPSASIQYIIALITLLTNTAERMTGVPSARSGQAASSSPVGTIQSNLLQSSYMTKPIMDTMSTFTEIGYQRCADIIRYLWQADETKAYIGGDMIQHVFKVTEEFSLSDIGIYIQSGVKVNQDKERVINLLEKTLATDPSMILEIIKAYNAESVGEVEQIVEIGVNIIRQQKQRMEQSKIDADIERNKIADYANKLKEEELRIKRTVPIEEKKISKQASENVALINKEAMLNQQIEQRITNREEQLFQQIAQENQPPQQQPQQQTP